MATTDTTDSLAGRLRWMPVDNAPFQKVVWVRNKLMEKPCKATRGYAPNGVVHPDLRFFTTVFTPDNHFPVASGRLVCPDEWAEVEEDNAGG